MTTEPADSERSSLLERLHESFDATPWSPLRLSATADGQPRIETIPDLLPGLLERLRDAPAIGMRRLVDLTAIDWLDESEVAKGRFVLVYSLHAPATHDRLRVHVPLAADDGAAASAAGEPVACANGSAAPTVDSVVRLWPAARWLEREVFDLFGIRFRGHPDLRRILLEPGFEGAPLRRDHPVASETSPPQRSEPG